MIIDCHTHAFSEKIAAKVVAQLVSYYNIPTNYGGEISDLLTAANAANLDGLFLLCAATKPEQVKPAHDWILSMAKLTESEFKQKYHLPRLPKITYFGTYHPDDPNWEAEIDRLKAAGIKGFKLHPEFQNIDLGDRRIRPFLEKIAPDFIFLTHVGDPVVSSENYSTPRKIAAIAKEFPELRIIAAHLGGLYFWEEVYEELAGKNIYFDTSSALSFIDPSLLRRLFSKHGTERMIFGSDYPLTSPKQALEQLDQINWLTTSEKERIIGENAVALLRSISH